MKTKKIVLLFFIIFLLISPFSLLAIDIEKYNYEVVNSYPHNKDAFTQGLEYYNGYLYEGTGLNGRSSLRKVDLKTGEIEQIHHLEDKYFGEGITIFNDKIYQLTWKSRTGFIYNLDFELIEKFFYKTEGWGLTHNNKELIMSDGSNRLYFLNPKTLEKTKEITVTKKGKKVNNLNELEYIKGKIYANVWQKDYIVIIEPTTGKVKGIIDLKGIINPRNYDYELNVLNGIAYDSDNDRLFVTGKLWPKIFEIKIKKD